MFRGNCGSCRKNHAVPFLERRDTGKHEPPAPVSHCDVRFYIYRSSVFGPFDARVVQSSVVIGVKTRLWSVLVDIETR